MKFDSRIMSVGPDKNIMFILRYVSIYLGALSTFASSELCRPIQFPDMTNSHVVCISHTCAVDRVEFPEAERRNGQRIGYQEDETRPPRTHVAFLLPAGTYSPPTTIRHCHCTHKQRPIFSYLTNFQDTWTTDYNVGGNYCRETCKPIFKNIT